MEICSRDASIYYLLLELFQELPKQAKETMKQASIESRDLRSHDFVKSHRLKIFNAKLITSANGHFPVENVL